MTVRIYIVFVCIGIAGFVSCKKSKGISAIKTPFIYGSMVANVGSDGNNNGITYPVYEYATAVFYNDSVDDIAIGVGNLIVNNNDSTLQFPYNQYAELSYNFEQGVTWNIPGFGDRPPFSYSSQGSFPSYTGILPDTINVLNGALFDVSAASTNNADTVRVRIGNNAGSIDITSSGEQQVKFTPEAFEIFLNDPTYAQNNIVNVYVTASKYDYQIINGKKFQFVRSYGKHWEVYLR